MFSLRNKKIIFELSSIAPLIRSYMIFLSFFAVAGIPAEKLVEAHGTFATATCTVCQKKLDGSEIKVKKRSFITFYLAHLNEVQEELLHYP